MKTSSFSTKTVINSDICTAFRWHEKDGALMRLTPPWEKIELLEKDEGIDVGARCRLNVGTGFFSIPWQAEHIEYYKDKHFKDIQAKGPFSLWEHSHDFEETDGRTTITDTVRYRLPMHSLTAPFAGSFIRKKLQRMFAYRSNVSKNDIETIINYQSEPKNIIISGSSGAVGKALIPYLQTQGHKTTRMVRNEKQLCIGDVCWNPNAGTIDDKLGSPDVMIHLGGEPIGDSRWSNAKKLSIVDSRVRSTSLIAKTISEMENPPKLLICASAIGYYGDRGEEELNEESSAGKNFISHVCYQWEKAAEAAAKRGVRVVFLRIGVALTPTGGALERMYKPFSAGLGPVMGSGDQYVSWISMDDVLYAVTHIMETESITGPVNLTSPHPARWTEFADTLANVLNRPRFLKIPESLIKIVYGQMGEEVLLAGSKVLPAKLLESGFKFRYSILEDALRHLLGRVK